MDGATDERAAAAGKETAAPVDVAAERMKRVVTSCFWMTVTLAVVLIAAKALARFEIGTLWDDAYMFQRYAHNILNEHRVAWNPGGPATYGLTAISFLVVVVPLYALTGGNVSLAAMLQSFVCGVALLPLLGALVWRASGAERSAKYACFALICFCCARSTLADHFVSGMDTTFGLTFLSGYLIAAHGLLRSPGVKRAVLVGALGGLAFSVRPELTAFAVLVPLSIVVFEGGRAERRAGALALGVTAAVLGAHLALAAVYFGTPLPLPFYAKSTDIYGSGIARAYRGGSTLDLIAWLESFWPLFAVIAVDVLAGQGGRTFGPRAWWRAATGLEKGVLAATLLCTAYSLFFVVPIMGFAQRFYYASLPGLIYAACRSTSRLARMFHDLAAPPATALFHAGCAAALVYLWFVLSTPLSDATQNLTRLVSSGRIGRFDIARHAKAEGPLKYWFGMDKFSALPDDLVMATTEVGMLGALNLNKAVIDLAGLNDRDYALERFSADRFFASHKPDLIYMPHPHYRDMIAALEAHPEMSGYDTYSASQLGAAQFGIAIRKESRYFGQMQAIVRERKSQKR